MAVIHKSSHLTMDETKLPRYRHAVDVPTHAKYRADIDGLRAIAVLSVVAFHAFPGKITGGFVGVDIFFVISGFLISWIIFSNLEGNSFSFADFYGRRIKRIFPALLIVMTATIALGALVLNANEYKNLGQHVAGGAAFLSNFVLWRETGYFDNAAETKPLLHLWSLGVEEQFYLVWPILVALVWKQRKSFFWTIVVIGIASFAVSTYYIASGAYESAFYLPVARFWELMAGGLLAYVSLYRPNWNDKYKDSQAVLGFLLIFLSILLLSKNNIFQGWGMVAPIVGSFLIISAGPVAWINRNFLSNQICVWFGLVSYPLYLWHWPLLSFLYIQYGTPSRLQKLIALLLSLALASITYYFIERAIRRSSYRWVPAWLAAALVVTGFAGLVVSYEGGFPSRRPASVARSLAQLGTWNYWSNAICERRYPYPYKKVGWWFCIQNRDQAPSIFLLGNSHANDLYPGLVKAFPNQTILSLGTCGPEADPEPHKNLARDNPCYDERRVKQYNFINGVLEETKPAFVIINTNWPSIDKLGGEEQLSAFVQKIGKRIEQLERLGSKVVLVLPRPKLRARVEDCFPHLFGSAADCRVPVSRERAFFGKVSDTLASLAEVHKDLKVFDQFPLFCDSETCRFRDEVGPFIRGNKDEHLSVYGSERFGSALRRWARVNLPELLTADIPAHGGNLSPPP